jgi:hypothetical protein
MADLPEEPKGPDFIPISRELGNFKRASLASLPHREATLYQFLVQKLGNSRVPRSVPLIAISKAVGLSYMQTWRSIDRLITLGFLEKFSEIHGEAKGDRSSGHFKRTVYYRLKHQTLF